MTTKIYKGYKVLTVGISRYIYRPGSQAQFGDALTQSMTAVKRWINEDIADRLTQAADEKPNEFFARTYFNA